MEKKTEAVPAAISAGRLSARVQEKLALDDRRIRQSTEPFSEALHGALGRTLNEAN